MSKGEVRKVTVQDLQLVQNLIERCLQLYMSQREVVSTLLHQAKIEPGFTELVWQNLETENQDFFKAYHLRMILKGQILRFNQLLDRQAELMRQLSQTGPISIPHSNGYQIHSMHNNIPDVNSNGASPMEQCMQVPVINMTTGQSGRIDLPENNMLLAQSPNVEMMQGMSGAPPVKMECSYASDSPLMFGAENNGIEDASSSFNVGESNSQALNEILDTETSLSGILGQMSRNFSLSDLTADFSNSNDILESYSRSPFVGTNDNFMDSRIPGEQQDITGMNSISEGFSYEGFSSN